MKSTFIILAFMVVGVTAIAQKINDPNAELRTAKNFHGISVSNAFDVYLSQSDNEAIAVSASDKNMIAKITTEVRGGILYVGLDKGWKWNNGNNK